jgi:hypothetical protein
VRALLGIIIRNWKLKLSAFALAMLLWITVSADQITARWLPVPVEIEIRDANHQLVAGPAPEDVEVRFSGPGRELWELAITRPPIRLIVRDASEGVQEFTLEPAQVQIPRGRLITAVDVRPATIQLAFQRLASAQVPVQVQVRNGPGPEFMLVGSLRVQPTQVRVSGLATRVNVVDAVVTRPIDLSGEVGPFERRVALDTTGLSGLKLSTAEVVISGQIDRVAERIIPGMPVQAPPGTLVIPGSVELTVRGGESVLGALDRNALQVVIPAELVPARIPPLGTEVPLRVGGLPAGVQVVAEPRTIRLITAPELPVTEIRTVTPQPDTTAAGQEAGSR